MRKIRNAVIMAGGDGSRFWPLINKSYLHFLNRPLLAHLIQKIEDFAENLYLVVNPLERKIAENSLPGVKIVEQKDIRGGQAGALLALKGMVEGETLLLNGNDLFDTSCLTNMIREMDLRKPELLILVKKVSSYFPGGYLKFNGSQIDAVIEKPEPGKEPSAFVKLVADCFADFGKLVESIEKVETTEDDRYEQAINLLIKKGGNAGFIEYKEAGEWFSLKYPWHVLTAMNYFLRTLDKKIVISKNVRIAKTAKITGPCYIGDGTVIGDFALVRESHIGNNCLIGGYSEVARSYLDDGVSLHRNYLGDSVIGKGVLFGAQAATANFRFDAEPIKSEAANTKINTGSNKMGAIIGSGAKIGVNATLLPGCKIGSNSFIGPGETVYRDVADNMFFSKEKIIKNKFNSP